MALQGTLKDFGIADILQLIGQQQKTGVLHLKTKDQEVQVGFSNGSIVKAETTTRRKKELIGNMLVRAQLITERQLEESLETQRRTLKRLGDVLVSHHFITSAKFKQMCQLQASETLYALFLWKSGTYAFEQGEVEHDPETLQPMRAESVLMEGFRMVDEWPMIRRKIASYDMTFEKLKPLPPAPVPEPAAAKSDAGTDDDGLDGAFGAEPQEKKGEFKSLGESERRIYGLAKPSIHVRQLIDISCLGEFETCKALTNLINLEYLKPTTHFRSKSEVGHRGESRNRLLQFGAWALSIGVVLTLLAFLATNARFGSWAMSAGSSRTVSRFELQRFLGKNQLTRINGALETYRTERGELPTDLSALVQAGLLLPDDLRYPWREPYYYRRVDGAQFVLLPPLR